MMLTHGVAPLCLLLSTLVHIPNNYRLIAISSILGKIFDTIILDTQ